MSEANIERAVVAHAESLGCIALKLRIDGVNGFPDRTLFYQGRVAFIEFKTPSGRLRPMQRVWLRRLRAEGFGVFRVSSVKAGRSVVSRFVGGSS